MSSGVIVCICILDSPQHNEVSGRVCFYLKYLVNRLLAYLVVVGEGRRVGLGA